MDQPAPESAIQSILQGCAEQPLEKLDCAVLQRAYILSTLSERAYAAPTLQQVGAASITGQPDLPINVNNSFSAAAYETLLLPSPQSDLLSCTIWLVRGVGVAVAFRGTADLQDLLADVSFAPQSLAASKLRLHGAIYKAAAQCTPSIEAAYQKAKHHWPEQQTIPLYLTGSSCSAMCISAEALQMLIWACDLQAIP